MECKLYLPLESRVSQSVIFVAYYLGIGKVVALEIAKTGGTVHLVCRNQERGQAAVNEIKDVSDNEVGYYTIAVPLYNV